MQAEWRDIKGYEGKYQVNTNGDVKSLISGRILRPATNKNGYLHVSLCKKDVRVHRIVAQTFLPNPDNLRDVNHINGDKTDNRVCNLEWVSHSMNELHKIYKLKKHGKLIRPMRRVLCVENGKVYDSISNACRDLGIKTNHISEVCSGKLKQTCGYHWRYM